jgi:hypothetical protein
MSKIQIGPHTRDDGHDEKHGTTYDREIDVRAIGKWMALLLVITVISQVLVWWLIRGFEWVDAKDDPKPTPIQEASPQQPPPYPRLQTAPGFAGNSPDALAKSDLEDMTDLLAVENKALDQPTWIDQGQGRVRLPIDDAMEVIAGRGNQGMGVSAAGAPGTPGTPGMPGTTTPQEMREQLPAGTSPGAPGATVQMSRPQTPAVPNEQPTNEPPAGAAQGRQPQQQTPRPPASQEQ